LGVVKKYCIDCGARLLYYPRLSNPKAENEQRVMVYGCPDCSDNFDKPKLIAIRRNSSKDPLSQMEVIVLDVRRKKKS